MRTGPNERRYINYINLDTLALTKAREGLGMAQFVLDLLQFLQQADAVIIVSSPRVGGVQAPRGPVQQRGAEMRLQLGDLLGDRRLGQAEPPRGGGKPARLDHVAEAAHGGKLIHHPSIVYQE